MFKQFGSCIGCDYFYSVWASKKNWIEWTTTWGEAVIGFIPLQWWSLVQEFLLRKGCQRKRRLSRNQSEITWNRRSWCFVSRALLVSINRNLIGAKNRRGRIWFRKIIRSTVPECPLSSLLLTMLWAILWSQGLFWFWAPPLVSACTPGSLSFLSYTYTPTISKLFV